MRAGGIDGHMLEAVIYDSEGDPAKAVSAVNKLIQQRQGYCHHGTFHHTNHPCHCPTSPSVPRCLWSAVLPASKSPPLWTHGYLKTAQSDLLAVAAVYQQMKDAGIKKIGILSVSNAYGESGKKQLLAQAEQFGLQVIIDENFGAKDTDTTTQLAKIKATGPGCHCMLGHQPRPCGGGKERKTA